MKPTHVYAETMAKGKGLCLRCDGQLVYLCCEVCQQQWYVAARQPQQCLVLGLAQMCCCAHCSCVKGCGHRWTAMVRAMLRARQKLQHRDDSLRQRGRSPAAPQNSLQTGNKGNCQSSEADQWLTSGSKLQLPWSTRCKDNTLIMCISLHALKCTNLSS